MNKVHLIGNLVKDPELRYTGNNKAVASYTIAITGRLKNKNYESNGVKQYSMQVVTEDIEFVGSKIEPKQEFIPSFEDFSYDDEMPF